MRIRVKEKLEPEYCRMEVKQLKETNEYKEKKKRKYYN
jgi:hypothetical protein